MQNQLKALKKIPFFLFLLPLFFVLHGYVQNRASVSGSDFLELLGVYLLASGVLFFLGWLLYRQGLKAALFAFVLLLLHFFFGAFHDALKGLATNFFMAKYSVLLPLIVVVYGLFFLYLGKAKATFQKTILYLNVILLLFILIDLPALFSNKEKDGVVSLPTCDTCAKPDVFLVIADEYADSTSLSQAFGFNNQAFLSALRNRGFHIVSKSRSSYNFTPYAMSSLLGMDYLSNLHAVKTDQQDLNICYSRINDNSLLSFFQTSGYDIRNFSIFNVANQPTKASQHYILIGKDRIRSQTLLERLKRDLGYHLVTTLKLKFVAEHLAFYTKRCNETLLQLLHNELQQKRDKPRFVYTHLLMPHFPYYYDKAGRLRDANFINDQNNYNRQAYVDYLQYSNTVFLQTIDAILRSSPKPPIILFMGDHGFRWFDTKMQPDNPLYYMNLNAVYLPGGKYDQFYEGISSVNQFRALLNTSFGQHLPFLKDTSYFINE